MRKLFLLLCLCTFHTLPMQPCKEYFWGITRLDEVPRGGQAVLSSNKKLVGYHIRSVENEHTIFTFYDIYRKKMAQLDYAPQKRSDAVYTCYLTDKDDQLNQARYMLVTWYAALRPLYYLEEDFEVHRKILEYTGELSHPILSLNYDIPGKLLMTDKPIVIEYEKIDWERVWSIGKQKLREWVDQR